VILNVRVSLLIVNGGFRLLVLLATREQETGLNRRPGSLIADWRSLAIFGLGISRIGLAKLSKNLLSTAKGSGG
jgi:hypothetical protein